MASDKDQAGAQLMENARTYKAIQAQLLEMIGRDWPAGTRLPPIKTLAQQIGAGQSNTHRAVKELVAKGLLVSKAGRGTFVLGSTADSQLAGDAMQLDAGSLRASLTGRKIQILAHANIHATYLSSVILAAEEVLVAAGAKVIQKDLDIEAYLAKDVHLNATKADAHVVFNGGENQRVHVLANQPVVCLSTTARVSIVGPGGYDVVMADSEQGGFLMGQHLQEVGCKSVCFIGVAARSMKVSGPGENQYDYTSALRLLGFEAGYGRTLSAEHHLYATNYATTTGAQMVQQYLDLKPRPRGVFCATDDLAIGFVHGALAHGIEPGKDFIIVGFDGQERSRHLPRGELTTAAIPTQLMGRQAAHLLITRMLRKDLPVRRLQLGCTLMLGDTTRSSR